MGDKLKLTNDKVILLHINVVRKIRDEICIKVYSLNRVRKFILCLQLLYRWVVLAWS